MTELQQEIAKAFAAQITQAVQLAASIPESRKLVDKAWMMAYFGVKASALEHIIAKPGFPDAIKIPGGPLRWKAVEVMDWAESQDGKRAKRGG